MISYRKNDILILINVKIVGKRKENKKNKKKKKKKDCNFMLLLFIAKQSYRLLYCEIYRKKKSRNALI